MAHSPGVRTIGRAWWRATRAMESRWIECRPGKHRPWRDHRRNGIAHARPHPSGLDADDDLTSQSTEGGEEEEGEGNAALFA